MSCAKFEPLIALYVENDLTSAEARLVESHLDTCEMCRGFAAGMRESQPALKSLRTEFVDGAVFLEIRAGAVDAIAREPKRAVWPRYAIAAGLVIALLAGWLWRTQRVEHLELRPIAALAPPAPLVPAKTARPSRVLVHSRRQKPRPRPSFKSELLLVKMLTDDPQVVIYWLVDQNGG